MQFKTIVTSGALAAATLASFAVVAEANTPARMM